MLFQSLTMNFVLVLVFGDKDALSIVPNSAGST
jgi:hypothetical protein